MPDTSFHTGAGRHIAPRPPATVMRLSRMGSAHPTRLSFLRVMLRRMTGGEWRFDRPVWQIEANGVGHAAYRAIGPDRTYSLVAFAHDLPDEMRSDRVIATAWDSTFTLFDGDPSAADIDRLARNVPLQEAGRISTRELSLSRANRSVRLFRHVVERLSQGQQPDLAEIDAVGYLMRTTAVYGSGKFGAADRSAIADRPEMASPFQAEMLSVWLIRQFTVDIVEHLAAARGGAAATRLDPAIKQRLGVGNSTGLGMAPFIVRHPALLHCWMAAREEALARVRRLDRASSQAVDDLNRAFGEAQKNAASWVTAHPLQMARLQDLRGDLDRIAARLADFPGNGALPWDSLWRWGEENLTEEGQEALLALVLEPHGDLIDGLAQGMSLDESAEFQLDGRMSIGDLRQILQRHYDWAIGIDFGRPENLSRFWYVSEEKQEPRLGHRDRDPGVALEQPLCVGWMSADLAAALRDWPDGDPVAAFLLRHPQHRYMVRRAQITARRPYAEIRDNLIAEDTLPIDMMRCKLAFFGASHFDPRSDKWVRICLFQHAPYPLDLAQERS